MHHSDSSGFRSNGSVPRGSGGLILVVGDSFTFGDEVDDDETWPAYLQKLAGRPVLNGGVFAYGVDQAVLRAQLVMDAHDPAVVIVAFVGDDVNRTEFSRYRAWKPYFEVIDGQLALRNSLVPRGPPPIPRFSTMRSVLGYSFLASAVLRRIARSWWYFGPIKKVHSQGSEVVVLLLRQLDRQAQEHDRRFLAVALPTAGRIGNNARIPGIVAAARAAGVDVLDLVPEFEQRTPSAQADLFLPGGHYTNAMNAWVASRVRDQLQQTETVAPNGFPIRVEPRGREPYSESDVESRHSDRHP